MDTSRPTGVAAAAAGALNASNATHATPALPWWRVGMVWLVLSGPLAVVVASLVTAAVAWRHIDPVINEGPGRGSSLAAEVAVPSDPKDALAPAMKGRNHAATPPR